MSVKLIAVDMDGTFLNDKKQYNQNRFREIYQTLKEKKIKFVVASGNQYYQLRSFFPEIESEIAFVAENGAYIIDARQERYIGEMSTETITKVLNCFSSLPYSVLAVCGRKSAYIIDDVSEEIYQEVLNYYHKLKRVKDLDHIDDTIFKFAASFPEDQVTPILQKLNNLLGDLITPVSSGHGDIDLIIPGIHKARGIKLLQDDWGISDDETAAFGDSGNDYEMIKHVKYGFAVENANAKVKEAAYAVIGSNNSESVLDTIESLI